jgi:hypothetical protein
MGAGGSPVTKSLPPGAILGRNLGGRSTKMIRKHFRFKRLVLGLAFVVAIAAFSASAVQAKPISGYGPLDPWAYAVIHQSEQANVVPAGNYGPLDPWAYAVIHRSSPTVVTARPDNGFNWSDAGIGASFVFGGALVLLTAVALGRRYRSRFDRSGLATS